MLRGYYLNRIVKDWSKFIEHARTQLSETERFNPGHPLYDIINRIKDRLELSKKYTDKIYTKGVSELLMGQLTPLINNIDNHYQRNLTNRNNYFHGRIEAKWIWDIFLDLLKPLKIKHVFQFWYHP